MSEPIIRIRDLSYRYGGREALRDLSLEVPAGAIYGFLGTNGSGKSTTIRLLMGLLRRQQGDVSLLGLDPARDPVGVKAAVGYVAENQSFYPWMRVGELIAFVARYRDTWDPTLADHLLAEFALDPEARIKELSKGQRAMVALFLAVAFRPRLLILDEPTGALDLAARRRFFEGVLAEYQEDGGTIFVSSHLIQEIAGLVDHVGILDGGTLRTSAPLDELRARLRRFELTFADGEPPVELACPGVLHRRSRARKTVLTVDFHRAEEEAVREALAAADPSKIFDEALSLEDLYLELTRKDGAP